DSHNTADAEKQTELRWRAVTEGLHTLGADAELVDRVRQALDEGSPAVGRGGRAVIVDHGVQLVERLIRPPEQPTVRLSKVPYLVPAIAHGVDDPVYALVIVDHAGADITVHRCGRTDTVTVDGEGYPVHKASG